ncbi:nucleoside/nucleotide kinase family protein [Cellulomonas sp. P24]|uniref:nucleoside/nucleotide kinase family protein n=1 Tax=Cellulomonas sp. P24 TaxID=2885206 RepID=UPI00216AF2AE|nr:nucleoside/nucleotide kinase family protein [Cellulomonas sp. P24]MCR6492242.1 nucleoside/nucleotide kinase family protein [Cellulomonas sp. P24]
MTSAQPVELDVDVRPGGPLPQALAARARRLLERAAPSGGPAVLGIVGAPGVGKSTLAAQVVTAFSEAAGDQGVRAAAAAGDRGAHDAAEAGGPVALLPMDGFHLANSRLEHLGRRDRKGAPDTFDATGYAVLLRRLGEPGRGVVHAPEYRREIEEAVAGAIAIGPQVRLVVTEGNYLLLDDGPWAPVAGLLTESWFLTADPAVRLERLVERHVRFGKAPEAARAWATGPDERNARLIAGTAPLADVVVHLVEGSHDGRLTP